jgi:glutathione S-transferase
MAPVAVVIVLAILEFVVIAWLVGRARDRYGIKAPATTGHEVFERWFRVQMNTLELLIAFIPAVSLFAIYVNPNWAAWIGLVYVAGRIVYARAYVTGARRSLGFGMSMLPILVLLTGALVGAVRAMLETNPAA